MKIIKFNDKLQLYITICVLFVSAFCIRYLFWQDLHQEVLNAHPVVTEIYKIKARILIEDGFKVLLDPNSRFADLNLHFHPLGYSFVIAGVYTIFGESNTAVQFFAITIDCLSVIIIFLIALELFSLSTAFLAAFFVSFSPSLAIYPVFLLPETLAYFPILLAVLFLIKAYKQPPIWKIALSGVLIGLSCWLRANFLILPLFMMPVILLIFPKDRRLKIALVFLVASVSVIAPMTIRNLIVYKRFIPVSLGAGQTLLEGIADYDKTKGFGIPKTDVGIARQEAESFNRPDYADSLFGVDGINRDRNRVTRALQVILDNPVWFAGVVIRRAFWMLQLERAPKVSIETFASESGFFSYLGLALRIIVNVVQSFLITAVILPLEILGGYFLLKSRRGKELLIIMAVPLYFFCVQSIFHTEYRYVLVVHYFLFILGALGAVQIFKFSHKKIQNYLEKTGNRPGAHLH